MTPVVHAWDDGHRIEPTTHEYRVSPNIDLSLSGLTDYYGGLTDAFPAQQTAAAVFAMSMVSRAFASAEVRPAAFAQTLSAPVRAMIGLESCCSAGSSWLRSTLHPLAGLSSTLATARWQAVDHRSGIPGATN